MLSVVTNKTPLNVLRGAGAPQATLVMERLLDEAARLLKIDRAEIRRRNLIQPGELPLDRGRTEFAGAHTSFMTRGITRVVSKPRLKLAEYG